MLRQCAGGRQPFTSGCRTSSASQTASSKRQVRHHCIRCGDTQPHQCRDCSDRQPCSARDAAQPRRTLQPARAAGTHLQHAERTAAGDSPACTELRAAVSAAAPLTAVAPETPSDATSNWPKPVDAVASRRAFLAATAAALLAPALPGGVGNAAVMAARPGAISASPALRPPNLGVLQRQADRCWAAVGRCCSDLDKYQVPISLHSPWTKWARWSYGMILDDDGPIARSWTTYRQQQGCAGL